MEFEYIILDTKSQESIAFLTFNRPASYNAMNKQMMNEIITAINTINNDVSINIAVIKGAGGNFMAGADIKEYAAQTSEEFLAFQKKGRLLYQGIEESDIPYVAMIDGYALGGGFEIALSCDFIFATKTAEMGLPEVHLALVPGGGGTQRLGEKVGINRAKEMLITGDRYKAERLELWGLVNKTYDPSELEVEVLEFCKKITRRSRKAITQLKFLATAAFRPGEFFNRLKYEGDICHSLYLGDEAQNKIIEFANKSKK